MKDHSNCRRVRGSDGTLVGRKPTSLGGSVVCVGALALAGCGGGLNLGLGNRTRRIVTLLVCVAALAVTSCSGGSLQSLTATGSTNAIDSGPAAVEQFCHDYLTAFGTIGVESVVRVDADTAGIAKILRRFSLEAPTASLKAALTTEAKMFDKIAVTGSVPTDPADRDAGTAIDDYGSANCPPGG
jgi:hypothetical protein